MAGFMRKLGKMAMRGMLGRHETQKDDGAAGQKTAKKAAARRRAIKNDDFA